MRLVVFSRFWLLQLQKSICFDVKTLTTSLPKRKFLLSAQTFTWAPGTLLGLIALFFSIKSVLLYFDFQLRFKSEAFIYTNPILFLDNCFYFSSRMMSWGFDKSDIFLRASVGKAYVKYNISKTILNFYFKSCTCYRFIDLFSKATIGGLPAFDVFWHCFITSNFFKSNLNFLIFIDNNCALISRKSNFFLLQHYLW
jgi:hypothetical protein